MNRSDHVAAALVRAFGRARELTPPPAARVSGEAALTRTRRMRPAFPGAAPAQALEAAKRRAGR